MSASIAIMASSNAAANLALIEAEHAHKISCHNTIATFESKGATQAQMVQYADCVNYLKPVELDATGTILLKVPIVLVLLGLVFGATRRADTIAERFIQSILAVGFVFAGEFCLFLIAAGLMFIFS